MKDRDKRSCSDGAKARGSMRANRYFVDIFTIEIKHTDHDTLADAFIVMKENHFVVDTTYPVGK
jgi:hypothetical protein